MSATWHFDGYSVSVLFLQNMPPYTPDAIEKGHFCLTLPRCNVRIK